MTQGCNFGCIPVGLCVVYYEILLSGKKMSSIKN